MKFSKTLTTIPLFIFFAQNAVAQDMNNITSDLTASDIHLETRKAVPMSKKIFANNDISTEISQLSETKIEKTTEITENAPVPQQSIKKKRVILEPEKPKKPNKWAFSAINITLKDTLENTNSESGGSITYTTDAGGVHSFSFKDYTNTSKLIIEKMDLNYLKGTNSGSYIEYAYNREGTIFLWGNSFNAGTGTSTIEINGKLFDKEFGEDKNVIDTVTYGSSAHFGIRIPIGNLALKVTGYGEYEQSIWTYKTGENTALATSLKNQTVTIPGVSISGVVTLEYKIPVFRIAVSSVRQGNLGYKRHNLNSFNLVTYSNGKSAELGITIADNMGLSAKYTVLTDIKDVETTFTYVQFDLKF